MTNSSDVSTPLALRRQQWAWAMYDWANSAFATTVLAVLFPIFYTNYYHQSATDAQRTFELGMFNTCAGLAVAIMAPVLGAAADAGAGKLRFLAAFTVLGVLATAALAMVGAGQWLMAGVLFALGVVGFNGALVFYDSLLVDVAEPKDYDRVSALGYGMGYLGGGLLLAVNVAMLTKPEWFGLADKTAAAKVSFLSVAVWWAAFSVPIFRRVAPKATRIPVVAAIRAGMRQIGQTFHDLRRLRHVVIFLVAYIIYIDAVNTVIRMATNFGISLKLPQEHLILAILVVQFVGFPAAIAYIRIFERWGARRGILIGLAAYTLGVVWGSQISATWEFYALAILIGCVQGGVQSLSRSYYSTLIPREKSGEFFGFYNMLGKFATVLGPSLMGVVALFSNDIRMSILSISIMFVAGAAVLWWMPEPPKITPENARPSPAPGDE